MKVKESITEERLNEIKKVFFDSLNLVLSGLLRDIKIEVDNNCPDIGFDGQVFYFNSNKIDDMHNHDILSRMFEYLDLYLNEHPFDCLTKTTSYVELAEHLNMYKWKTIDEILANGGLEPWIKCEVLLENEDTMLLDVQHIGNMKAKERYSKGIGWIMGRYPIHKLGNGKYRKMRQGTKKFDSMMEEYKKNIETNLDNWLKKTKPYEYLTTVLCGYQLLTDKRFDESIRYQTLEHLNGHLVESFAVKYIFESYGIMKINFEFSPEGSFKDCLVSYSDRNNITGKFKYSSFENDEEFFKILSAMFEQLTLKK